MTVEALGVIMIIVGVIIQIYERYANKSHLALRQIMEEHTEYLEESAKRPVVPENPDAKLPDGGPTVGEAAEIVNKAVVGASKESRLNIGKVEEEFKRRERKKEPYYWASYALIIIGTALTAL